MKDLDFRGLENFSSTLNDIFSEWTISLVARIVYSINQVFLLAVGHSKLIESQLDVVSELLSFEISLQRFLSVIARDVGDMTLMRLSINRRIASDAIEEGRDAHESSIVAQVTQAFKHLPFNAGRCFPLPWKVTFIGEEAIDAGGPGKELLNEFSTSIFQPTSKLVIPSPTSAEFFVPFSENRSSSILSQYRMIGVFLGIVIRAGICQSLPFAPFVYRFVAGEEIHENDIIAVDSNLGGVFRGLRAYFPENDTIQWTVLDWMGTLKSLPHHAPNSTVKEWELEKYVKECVQYRVDLINPFLAEIRAGFINNTGVVSSPYLSGYFLARACQGDEFVSVQDLKSVAVYVDYTPNDPTIMILWRIIEEMTNDQRSLFLKFVTTMTRIPIRSQYNFKLEIHRLSQVMRRGILRLFGEGADPNQEFPKASTCFNRMYLPPYSNFEAARKKITYAIICSPTLEQG
jgi:hypothetical protein